MGVCECMCKYCFSWTLSKLQTYTLHRNTFQFPVFKLMAFLFSTPSPAFIACRLLDSSHSDWHEMVPHCCFDLHFSNNEWCWASFHVLHCWWECKLVQPLWRTVWRLLKKLEIELLYNPAIPLLGIRIKETRSERDIHNPMFIAALFIIAKTLK